MSRQLIALPPIHAPRESCNGEGMIASWNGTLNAHVQQCECGSWDYITTEQCKAIKEALAKHLGRCPNTPNPAVQGL